MLRAMLSGWLLRDPLLPMDTWTKNVDLEADRLAYAVSGGTILVAFSLFSI